VTPTVRRRIQSAASSGHGLTRGPAITDEIRMCLGVVGDDQDRGGARPQPVQVVDDGPRVGSGGAREAGHPPGGAAAPD
jgi:hypothetical protein